jgi:hypothetical protein
MYVYICCMLHVTCIPVKKASIHCHLSNSDVCELASLELRLHRLTLGTVLVEASVDTSIHEELTDEATSTSDASSSMTGPGVSMITVVSGLGANAKDWSSKNHKRSEFAHHGRAFCHAFKIYKTLHRGICAMPVNPSEDLTSALGKKRGLMSMCSVRALSPTATSKPRMHHSWILRFASSGVN